MPIIQPKSTPQHPVNKDEDSINKSGNLMGKIVSRLKEAGKQINSFFKRVGQYFDHLIHKKSDKQLTIKDTDPNIQNKVYLTAKPQFFKELTNRPLVAPDLTPKSSNLPPKLPPKSPAPNLPPKSPTPNPPITNLTGVVPKTAIQPQPPMFVPPKQTSTQPATNDKNEPIFDPIVNPDDRVPPAPKAPSFPSSKPTFEPKSGSFLEDIRKLRKDEDEISLPPIAPPPPSAPAVKEDDSEKTVSLDEKEEKPKLQEDLVAALNLRREGIKDEKNEEDDDVNAAKTQSDEQVAEPEQAIDMNDLPAPPPVDEARKKLLADLAKGQATLRHVEPPVKDNKPPNNSLEESLKKIAEQQKKINQNNDIKPKVGEEDNDPDDWTP